MALGRENRYRALEARVNAGFVCPRVTPLMAPLSFLEFWSTKLAESGVDVRGWLLAWARVSPLVALVPIFGGAALPGPARAGLGVALASAIAPALRPVNLSLPLPMAVAAEVARGLPVALGAAVLVHGALMVGGLVDDLRGARAGSALPVFEGEHTPLGALFGLLIALALLESGAASKLVAMLAQATPHATLLGLVSTLTASVGIALAVAAPILGVAVVLSVAEALFSRAASPAHVSQLLGPLRSIILLGVLALALERIEAALLLALRV